MKKNVTVFGGTGGTGLEIVSQLLAKDHRVTALVRDSKPLESLKSNSNLRIVEGSVFNKQDVEQSLPKDTNVIVNSLGGRRGGEPDVCSKSQVIINEVAKSQNIARQIVVTSLGVNESYDYCSYFTRGIIWAFISKPIADKCIQENSIRSDPFFRWTFVRPGGLNNGPLTGKYRVDPHLGGGRVSRADVAHFVVTTIEQEAQGKEEWVGKAPVLVD
eukprot:TRINITY_DN1514_c0_g1_i1.p1 TRINITY_DN1514_c0_g1~~TRINITY_DN1514_c0_g1_i1.p1  ORF type:complete len:216 (+),score=54.15 TRINITY_DN1514_c0_g1_i1:652-1299(+)